MVREPDYLIVMNDLSLEKFESKVQSGGVVILDSSLISNKWNGMTCIHTMFLQMRLRRKKEIRARKYGPAWRIYRRRRQHTMESIYDIIDHSFTGSKAKYADPNKRLVREASSI